MLKMSTIGRNARVLTFA